jgi:hypothetical protein
MIVNLNGNYWYDTEKQLNDNVIEVKKSKKLMNFAITIWTTSGLLFAKTAAHAESFYESMKPLNFVFQDIALGLGVLFAFSGFILLGVKKRWGAVTLKTTAMVVCGVFLVPSAIMLVAIVGTLLNDALTVAFENIRGASDVKDVIGK